MPTNIGLDERPAATATSSARRNAAEPKPGSRDTKAKGAREHKLGATARSFAILEHVASSRTPVDVLDIISSVRLPKATAYRLVDWFISQGYLSREPGRRRLIVGPKLTNLAFGALSSSMRHDTPHVVLQRLVHTLNETCNIGTLVNGEVAYLDRVEWHIIPDQETVVAALQTGEVDWDEYPVEDMLPKLRRDARITTQKMGSVGWWGLLRPNCLYPPFSNPAIRRALLGAIEQREFMSAAIGADPSLWRVPTGYFPPDSPMASDAGMDALSGPRDLGKVRKALLDAGYGGEKVVLIAPATLWRARMFSDVAADLLRKIGMNVDEQIMDTTTWAKRLVSRKPPDEGGWNLFCTSMQGMDALSPATHPALRGNGDRAFPGWPTSARIEALREEWLDAPDEASRRRIAVAMQDQAFIDVPYIPLGTFYPSTAYRSSLTGVLDGQAIFWNVRRRA